MLKFVITIHQLHGKIEIIDLSTPFYFTLAHMWLYKMQTVKINSSFIKLFTVFIFNTFMPNIKMLSISFLPLVTYIVLVEVLCLSLSLFSSVLRVKEINDHVSDGLLFNISISLDFYYINKEIRALMNLTQTVDLIF